LYLFEEFYGRNIDALREGFSKGNFSLITG
jgi:hypothetical protein